MTNYLLGSNRTDKASKLTHIRIKQAMKTLKVMAGIV